MATVLEALQNANYNLENARHPVQVKMAKNQLNNAVTILEKGYDTETEVEDLIRTHGKLDNIPEKI